MSDKTAEEILADLDRMLDDRQLKCRDFRVYVASVLRPDTNLSEINGIGGRSLSQGLSRLHWRGYLK